MDDRAIGLYENLMAQYASWARHNNRGAFKTRDRYAAAVSSFCGFIAEHFALQKLANVQPKHIEAYVTHLVTSGKASSTIRTNLSGVRYVLDSFPGRERAKPLPTNGELTALADAPKRAFHGIDRAWSNEEFTGMVNKATELARPLVAYTLGMAYAQGLRIHEVMQIDHDRATKALTNGYLSIKGKGGRWRDIELTDMGRRILVDVLKSTTRGRRCFIEANRVTHQQIASVQRFIRDHRGTVEGDKKLCEVRDAAYLKVVAADGYKPHITFHGLRHAYARRLYTECVKKGMSPSASRKYVAQLLGHGRDAVTRIYLGPVRFTRGKMTVRNGNREDIEGES